MHRGDARASGCRGRPARGGGLGGRRRPARLRRRLRRLRHPRHGAGARRRAAHGRPLRPHFAGPQFHRRRNGTGRAAAGGAPRPSLRHRRAPAGGPGARWHLELEHDDGMQEVEIELPAVFSVAERLCDPCKVDPEGRAAVPSALLAHVSAADLGPGPWGEAGSPTVVGRDTGDGARARPARPGRTGRHAGGGRGPGALATWSADRTPAGAGAVT